MVQHETVHWAAVKQHGNDITNLLLTWMTASLLVPEPCLLLLVVTDDRWSVFDVRPNWLRSALFANYVGECLAQCVGANSTRPKVCRNIFSSVTEYKSFDTFNTFGYRYGHLPVPTRINCSNDHLTYLYLYRLVSKCCQTLRYIACRRCDGQRYSSTLSKMSTFSN